MRTLRFVAGICGLALAACYSGVGPLSESDTEVGNGSESAEPMSGEEMPSDDDEDSDAEESESIDDESETSTEGSSSDSGAGTTSTEASSDETSADSVGTLLVFSDVQDVFARCVSCHTYSNGAFRVSDGPSRWATTRSSSEPYNLVVPRDPADSYIYMKITGDDRVNGRQMPSDVRPLPDDDIALIEQWILDGARN